eukprot:271532-Prymnesium_polylepis.1
MAAAVRAPRAAGRAGSTARCGRAAGWRHGEAELRVRAGQPVERAGGGEAAREVLQACRADAEGVGARDGHGLEDVGHTELEGREGGREGVVWGCEAAAADGVRRGGGGDGRRRAQARRGRR